MKWADPPQKERKKKCRKQNKNIFSFCPVCVCVSIHRPYCMGLAHVFCSPPIVRLEMMMLRSYYKTSSQDSHNKKGGSSTKERDSPCVKLASFLFVCVCRDREGNRCIWTNRCGNRSEGQSVFVSNVKDALFVSCPESCNWKTSDSSSIWMIILFPPTKNDRLKLVFHLVTVAKKSRLYRLGNSNFVPSSLN